MRNIVLFFLALFNMPKAQTQVPIYIHQPSCNKVSISVANHPEYSAKQLDTDTQVIYIDKLSDPQRISLVVGTIGFHIEDVWIEANTEKIDCYVYNCRLYKFIVENPNSLTSEERINRYFFDYLDKKYTSDDGTEYFLHYHKFIIDYIKNNPNSYLSLDYVTRANFDNKTVKEMLSIMKSMSSYKLYKSIASNINESNRIKVGDTLHTLVCKDILDKTFSSKNLPNMPTVITVWQTGCQWSNKILPQIINLNSKYKNINFIYYSLDENRAQWEYSTKKINIPNNNISNLDGYMGEIPTYLNIKQTPTFIILDEKQKIEMVTFGDEIPLIERTLQSLLMPK